MKPPQNCSELTPKPPSNTPEMAQKPPKNTKNASEWVQKRPKRAQKPLQNTPERAQKPLQSTKKAPEATQKQPQLTPETTQKLLQNTPGTPNIALIKALRKHFRVSQIDLAHMSGVSLATISKLESGVITNPQLGTLNAIAGVFNIATTQLLHTETPEPRNFALAEQLRTR